MTDTTAENVDLVGGHPVLDFVNTVAWRPDPQRRIDYLQDFAALLAWTRRVEVTEDQQGALARAAQEDPDAARGALDEARHLRETLYAVLDAAAAAQPPAERDLNAFHHTLLKALDHATPVQALPFRWRLEPRQPADITYLLALAGIDLLRSPDLGALRRCHNPACGWLFLDRSRSHTRRWCSSADCGNRERVRRHASRHRAT